MEKTDKKIYTEEEQPWLEQNRNYVLSYLKWLRTILHRRILWLRIHWQHDPLHKYRIEAVSDAQADWLLIGEDYPAERKFYIENEDARNITAALDEAKLKAEEQALYLRENGTPAALDVLTQIFGLNTTERILLMMCLAPEIDTSFERLYAYIQDDISRKYVTGHLAASLFANISEGIIAPEQSFLPEAPLFKFRLIKRELIGNSSANRNSTPLKINSRIADYLMGINRQDETAAEFMKPLIAVYPLPERYIHIINRLNNLLNTNKIQFFPRAINLTGSDTITRRNIAAKLCEEMRILPYILKQQQAVSSGIKVKELISLLERECLLLPGAIYMEDYESEDNNDQVKILTQEFIEEFRGFFILGSSKPRNAEREILNITVPKLTASEQKEFWKMQLNDQGTYSDENINALVEQFDFEPDMIAKAVTSYRLKNNLEKNDNEFSPEDIWAACREQSQNDLEDLAQSIVPCYDWEDIVLPKETFEQLRDIASQVAHRSLVYEKWGYGVKLSRGHGISALFSGPSGTGKTMAAEILAGHLKLNLYRIDLSAIVSKYIGETEKNLKKVFDAAERSGAILFFDEADALFGKRSEVKDSHDRYANIEINYLLQRMEDYRGLAILATNMKTLLDQAFLRRLRFHVDFPFPSTEYRNRIWQKSFPEKTTLGNIDFNFLAKLEIPGGNIKNISLNAAFLAADNGCIIQMDHILKATKREYSKIGKMILESEFGRYYEAIKQ